MNGKSLAAARASFLAGRLAEVWRTFRSRSTVLMFCPLSSRSQSRCQPLGQIRGQDLFLRYPHVVRDAIKGHDPRIRVEHRKRRTPVAIAWLPDRAGIDEVVTILA